MSPTELTLEALGSTSQLEATARDQNGTILSAPFNWSSSNTAVLTVDSTGQVTAVDNGTATVTVRSGTVSASATVTVEQQPARIELSSNEVLLTALGANQSLEASIFDANDNAVSAELTWASSVRPVAAVDSSGRVTAQANGTAIITAAAGSVSASAVVTVDQRVASVSILPVDTSTLNIIGATTQLHAIARDANGHTLLSVEIDWISSDRSVATVDGTGLLTAQGDGTTEIRASMGAFFDTLTLDLSVRQGAVIVVTPWSSLLDAFDATVQLQAEMRDADGQATSVPVAWTSSDPAIAAVDASGLITGRGNGTATITARYGEASGTATVKVLQRIRHVRITPETASITLAPVLFTSIGETVQFTAQALDSNQHAITEATFTASPRESGIVSIDDTLLATAIDNGHTAIEFSTWWAGSLTVSPAGVRVRQVATDVEIEPDARTFRTVDEAHQFTATARDANGHPLPADFVYWESADRRVADVDTTGLVSITGVGETTITALTPDGASDSATVTGDLQATCVDGDRTPSIGSVAPALLVEGTTFEIQGLGFCGESAGNLVTVDRMVAAVEALSETRLSVTVPQFHCLPSRRVSLAVAVGQNRATRSVDLEPDERAVSLAVGRQSIWGAGEDKCLQFRSATGPEAYLIGVQSTLLTSTNDLTPVRLVAATEESAAAISADAPEPKSLFGGTVLHYAQSSSVAGRVYEPEHAAPDSPWQEAPNAIGFARPMAADRVSFPDKGDIETLPKVGDIVTIPDSDRDWLVYSMGTRAMWLLDTELIGHVEDRYPGAIEGITDIFDNEIYPIITDFFGAWDLGRTGRVVVRFGRCCANAIGKADRDWHMIQLGTSWLSAPTSVVAHEFVHVLQQAAAWKRPTPRSTAPVWFREAQAEIGQEILAWALENLSPGQNYGTRIVHGSNRPRYTHTWHSNFYKLTTFLDGRYPESPQECSWLVHDASPCVANALVYGVGWSLLRYLTDQYARRFPGGEATLHQELIGEPQNEAETIERLLAESLETLLARWAAALYVDDRIPNADPTLNFTSWNFFEISQSPRYSHPDGPTWLKPLEISFSSQERRARIRDGSIWYVRIEDLQRSATAIRVRDLTDNRALPEHIQTWVVRLK